jgi:hypothetical protein
VSVALGIWLRRLSAACFLAVAAATPVHAAERPAFTRFLPNYTVAEAFAEPYGKLLVDELAGILEKSSDPACLAAKGLTREKLARAGEAILVKHGQRTFDFLRSFTDGTAADKHFAEATGGAGLAELQRLAADRLVKELIALDRPGTLDRLVDSTTETFDRYVLLNRIRLAAHVSPISTGSDLMKENRDESSSEAVERFLEENGAPEPKRYVELAAMAEEAVRAATNHDEAVSAGAKMPR